MSNELIHLVANAKRTTKVKAYVQTRKQEDNVPLYDSVMIGDLHNILPLLQKENVLRYELEVLSHQSAMGLENFLQFNARIEPGALIRQGVQIDDGAVVLMGAVLNTGVHIGSDTMVDMNAVIGSGAVIGKRCHIGAGAVIAGMMEPASNQPVVIDDDVFVGANAVILEGVHVGRHSVIGAGAVVNKDVEENSVVAGVPARKIKENKTDVWIEKSLRQ